MTHELKTQIIDRWNSGENTMSISCDLDIPLEEVNMAIIEKVTPKSRKGEQPIIYRKKHYQTESPKFQKYFD